ncbi:MAG: HAMP domain-containing histidine kinase [Ruminococcaceae bacterium]|nr:HAMP domain-containing histidine kinase [Oscillospiraceae bacterium]
MVEKLRHRITYISIAAISIVLVVMCIALSLGLRFNYNKSADRTLAFISENISVFEQNKLPSEENYDEVSGLPGYIGFGSLITEDTALGARFFIVTLDRDGAVVDADISHISDVSEQKGEMMARKVFKEHREKGNFQHFRFTKHHNNDGTTDIIFLNCVSLLRPLYFAQFMSICISLIIVGAMTFIVWLLSKKVADPFLETLDVQKQFITNAGHEIKTPLAIIDANAEVIKLTQGDSEWIESIQNQTKRLSALVRRLVLLAKAEETSFEKMTHEKFSVSDAVMETAGAFYPITKAKEIILEPFITPDIYYKGDEGAIRQLIEILLDNAVKYCSEKGRVTVTLKPKGKSVCLEVTNDCTPPDKKTLDKLFDRFYRADSSRSRKTGGYGIGLSIAKAITDNHKGKISASAGVNSITFTVIL